MLVGEFMMEFSKIQNSEGGGSLGISNKGEGRGEF
jgi:hypothetical protein